MGCSPVTNDCMQARLNRAGRVRWLVTALCMLPVAGVAAQESSGQAEPYDRRARPAVAVAVPGQLAEIVREYERGVSRAAGSDIMDQSQRSSVVEQRFRKPPVVSSTLTAGSTRFLSGTPAP